MSERDQTLEPGPLDPKAETAVRRAAVVDRYRLGRTFKQIGDELGFTMQRAHQIYWDAMTAIEEKSVAARRAQMADQLDEVVRVASEVMAADHIAHSNGRVVMMTDPETGEEHPVLDHAPKLDAGRTIIAAQARFAKMIGADAAVKVEQDSTVRYEVVNADVDGVV